jgi:hypothetical protein
VTALLAAGDGARLRSLRSDAHGTSERKQRGVRQVVSDLRGEGKTLFDGV